MSSRTIIDYHAPFDRGFTCALTVIKNPMETFSGRGRTRAGDKQECRGLHHVVLVMGKTAS